MPLNDPDRTLLAAAPLLVTIAQVRFDVRETVADVAAGAQLVDRARALGLPTMTQIHQQQVLIVNAPPADQPPQQQRQPAGWQYATKDGSVVLTLLTDQMTLETKAYPGWDAFAATWQASLELLTDVAGPALTTRLGLRYVNRITPARMTRAGELKDAGLVDPAFLGPAVDSDLSEYVTAAEGRVALSFPDNTDALVQHGVVTENGTQAFILDIDCFRTTGASFHVDTVMAASTELNERALQVFQTVVREPLRAEMKRAVVR